MRNNVFAGRKGLWLREQGDTGERELEAILDTLTGLGGANLLCLKVMDGTNWVSSYDAATPIGAVADVLAAAAACRARGVELAPVVCPRGVAGEAGLHGQIAAAAGCLEIDLEPYGGFFDQLPLTEIPVYCHDLRAAAGEAYLLLQPDPRPYAWGAIDLPGIAPYFDGIAGQHYVGWVDPTVPINWSDVGGEVARFQLVQALGRDTYVTLWGENRTDLAGQFWGLVQPQALGCQAFAFGGMNADQLRWFAGLPAPVQPQPRPVAMTNDDIVQTERLILAGDVAGAMAYLGRFTGVAS